MFGPDALTHFMYCVIPVVFLAVVAYTVYYSRHQNTELKKAERNGMHPHSVDEALLMAQQQDRLDKLTARPKHAHH